jgi:hypothetical protein
MASRPTSGKATPARRVSLERARARWHAAQRLDREPAAGERLDDVIAATGWLRTLGGVDVYLATRGRVPSLRRADLDDASARREVRVSPAVRGCIYLVPACDQGLSLRIADEQSRARQERDCTKAGVPRSEVDEVANAVVSLLGRGPLSTDAIRKGLPPGTVRSLGEAGKKVGLSSPLPVALRQLEFDGRIERTLVGGRLDTERYEWRLTARSPYEEAPIPSEPAGRIAEAARRFLRWAGPARKADFAEWCGCGVKDATAALGALDAVPVAVDGYSDDAWILPAELPALDDAPAPAPLPRFLSFEDNFLALHGGPALLTDPRHHSRPAEAWGGAKGPQTLGTVRHLQNRSLLLGDRLAGFWEFDPDSGEVVTAPFEAWPASTSRSMRAAASELAAFIRDEVGHGRSFSLDSDAALRERARTLRATLPT